MPLKIFAMGFRYRTEVLGVLPFLEELSQISPGCQAVFFKGIDPEIDAVSKHIQKTNPRYCKVLTSCLNPDQMFQIERGVKEFSKVLKLAKKEPSVTARWSHLGIDFRGFIEPFVSDSLSHRRLIQYFELTKKYLSEQKPDLLILPGIETSLSHLTCLAARAENVKTISIPHYSLQISLFSSFATKTYNYTLVDYWAVLNSFYREVLTREKVDPSRICITGLPKFQLHPCKTKNLQEYLSSNKVILKKMNRGKFTKCILLTLQGFPDDACILKVMKSVMGQFPETVLLIRPHPITKTNVWAETFRRCFFETDNVYVVRQADFLEQLALCDVLITLTSVTAFEAVLHDKPVIVLNLSGRFYPYVGIKEGALVEITRESDVVDAIRKMFYDRVTQEKLKAGRQKLLKDYGPPDPCGDSRTILKEFIQSKIEPMQSVDA